MLTYFNRHLQVLFSTLGSILRTPFSSLITILVIGISLLLPSLFYTIVKSGELISNNWAGRPQMTIFMQKDIALAESELIFDEIRLNPAVKLAELISPTQALEEFKILSGLNHELHLLNKNPLPPSIVLMPSDSYAKSDTLIELKEQLLRIDGIESIRLDLDWTDRFNAILRLFSRFSVILTGLLLVAMILIVSNTIKLLILNRRQEIEITKLVGGTNSFVRRPFLYYGWLYGLFGAVFALLILYLTSISLKESIETLSDLYNGSQILYYLSIIEMVYIVLAGSFIGWLSARWSVAYHLHKIRPT